MVAVLKSNSASVITISSVSAGTIVLIILVAIAVVIATIGFCVARSRKRRNADTFMMRNQAYVTSLGLAQHYEKDTIYEEID